jgi:hypothetical protein
MPTTAETRRRAVDRYARRYRVVWRRLLDEALARYQRRIEVVLSPQRSVHRVLSASDLERILAAPEEVARLLEDFPRDLIEQALREAARRELSALGRAALMDALDIVRAADLNLGRMVVAVSGYTRERVGAVVSEGIDRGASIADIQASLQRDPGFSPMRALRIARTESARAVAEGAQMAYQQAAMDGVDFELEWSTAGFNERPEHKALDGQRVAPGGLFVVPVSLRGDPSLTGRTAPGPTLFNVPALDINCRCTLLPIVRD